MNLKEQSLYVYEEHSVLQNQRQIFKGHNIGLNFLLSKYLPYNLDIRILHDPVQISLHSPAGLCLHARPKARIEPTARAWISTCPPPETSWAAGVVVIAAWVVTLVLISITTVLPARGSARGGCLILLTGQHSHHAPATLEGCLSSCHHGWIQAKSPKIHIAVWTATTAKALPPKPPESPTIHHLPTIIVLRLSVGDVHAGSFDDQVLTTQRLGNLEGKKTSVNISREWNHETKTDRRLTWSSAKVTKAKARKGLGMNTSVTSPYCIKNCLSSSAVMSSVQRPTNTFLLLIGSSGPACSRKY